MTMDHNESEQEYDEEYDDVEKSLLNTIRRGQIEEMKSLVDDHVRRMAELKESLKQRRTITEKNVKLQCKHS